VSVCLRKLAFTRDKAYAFARTLMDQSEVLPVEERSIDRAGALAMRHQLSHWNALIIASEAVRGTSHQMPFNTRRYDVRVTSAISSLATRVAQCSRKLSNSWPQLRGDPARGISLRWRTIAKAFEFESELNPSRARGADTTAYRSSAHV